MILYFNVLLMLKANIGSLSVPTTLSNSTYLKDLTTLTKVDFVGQNLTAASLGLSETYTVSLLTLCGKNSSNTECSHPSFGFSFKPDADLKLADTSLHDLLPGALPLYGNPSRFLGLAYTIALVLAFIAPLVNLFTHSKGSALFSAIVNVLSTILLFATAVGVVVIFSHFNTAFNLLLKPFGAHSSLGAALIAFAWSMAFFSLTTTILLFRSHQAAKSQGMNNPKGEAAMGGTRALRMLNKIPTWKNQPYSQIKKEGVRVQNVDGAHGGADDDFDPLVRSVGMEGAEDEVDLEESHTEGPHRAIPMQVFKMGPQRDADTAYEPFRESG